MSSISKFAASLLKSLGLNTQPVEEFAPAPPIKEHAPASAQLDVARAFHSVKEIAQALQNDLQDRGGIADPVGYITQLKQEAAMAQQAVVVLVKGQRFMAPKGHKIKEVRPSGEVLLYGSIFRGRKLNNEKFKGSKFSLVRS